MSNQEYKPSYTQDAVEIEKQRRICVAVWAYAYEELCASIVSDSLFDDVCNQIDVNISTDNPVMDRWFKIHFEPCTGSWIGQHPEKEKIRLKAIQMLSHFKINYRDNLTKQWVMFPKEKEQTVQTERATIS